MIIFGTLAREGIVKIVDLQMERFGRLLAERGLEIEITPAAREALAGAGYDPAFGARPLRRAIQRMVQDPLALELLEGRFSTGDRVVVDAEAGEIKLNRSEPVGSDPAFSR